MSSVFGAVQYGFNIGLGALMQLVNVGTTLIRVKPPDIFLGSPPEFVRPIPWVQPHAQGDSFIPIGPGQNEGADLVDAVLGRVGLAHGAQSTDVITPRQRRLLARTAVQSTSAGQVARVRFRAGAPNSDWGRNERESSIVSVYIDGRHHSEVVVLSERTGVYEVNLGSISPGRHTVELRSARDLAGAQSADAQITHVAAGVRRRGLQTIIDRHAPILQTRDLGTPGGRPEFTHTDTPLLMLPQVTDHRDGTLTIVYNLLLSNEDGGANTPQLFTLWGRTTDYEPVYEVRVDARTGARLDVPRNGSPAKPRFQGPGHVFRKFEATFEADRPVIRIATGNNNFAQRLRSSGPRWSEAPTAPISMSTTPHDVMLSHPWTFAVSSKEAIREGHARLDRQPNARTEVGDPRRFLYLNALPLPRSDTTAIGARSQARLGASALAKGIVVQLDDGSWIGIPVTRKRPLPENTTIALPPGVDPQRIVAVDAPAWTVFVLDDRFAPRTLLQPTNRVHNRSSRSRMAVSPYL